MKSWRTTCLAGAMLGLATLTQAGILSPGMEAQLQATHPQDELKVLVVLEARADIEQLDNMLREGRASMALRHETVINALQDVAMASQPPVLASLDRLQAAGKVLGYTPHWLMNCVVVRSFASVVPELAAIPGVDVVEPDLVPELIEPVLIESPGRDSREIGVTPGIRSIEADRVWYELGITGVGVIVGNMDTGVNVNHEALQSRWRGNFAPAAESWLDVNGGGSTPTDNNGHGSHVMGTITGLAPNDSIGVCPGAQWIATNVIDSGTGPSFDNNVIIGLEWFADPDGDPGTVDDMPVVVQHSWGVNENFSGYVDCDSRWWDALDNSEAAGVCHTWSAGNEGSGSGTMRSPGDRASSVTNSFSVGSSNTAGTQISSFSSRGPAGNNCGFFNIKPEITAPGSDIYSVNAFNNTGYTNMSGTSMAGPHIAGVVGLMRAANPDLDVETVKTIMMETAEDRGTAGEDNTWGWGLVNAYEAVLQAMSGYATLEGTVTASDTGDPLAGVLIEELVGGRNTTSDENGYYSLSMPAGSADFQATVFGFDTHTWTLDLEQGELLVHDFMLDRAPSALITGTVRTPEGIAFEGALVEALGTPLPVVSTDVDGGFEFLLPVGATVTIESMLDTNPTSRPQGPDTYGYVALDPSDWAWSRMDVLVEEGGEDITMQGAPTPAYDWTTCDPDEGGIGTALDFSGGDDITVQVDLPFDFMYYGQSYSQVSICGNGWVAMGVTSSVDYSNGTIPDGEDGPPAMIAACWEDYSPQQEVSGNISIHHDAAGGRFIIEYNHIRQYSPTSAFESFQLILMDPAVHETLTGDGAILVQYAEVSDLGSATIGIESPDATDGLQYYYADSGADYAVENLPIEVGSTVLFTTGLLASTPSLQPVQDLEITLLPTLDLRLNWSPAALAVAYRVEARSVDGAWMPLGETTDTEWYADFEFGAHSFRVVSLGE